MLNIKERQKRLIYLGYYNGKIDGIESEDLEQAYYKLQKEYFKRKKDITGIYDNETDILLQNAYNVRLICHDFKLKDFSCRCNGKFCNGYPYIINTILLANLQIYRNKLNTPIFITSALRCNKWNEKIGGLKNSRHKEGKAIDFYTKYSQKLEVRKTYIDKWIKEYKESRYGYCKGYGNLRGDKFNPSASYLVSAIHIDIE